MAQAFFINAPKRRSKARKAKGRPARDAKGIHVHWKPVGGHLRRVNPLTGAPRKARRKLSRRSRVVRSARRAARRARRFSPAQLAAQRRFAAMARARAASARGARRSASTLSPRTGGSMARKKRRRSAAPSRRRSRRVKHRRNPGYSVSARRSRRRKSARRHRRNPSFQPRGILSTVTRGFGDGLAITVGAGLTKFVASKIPIGQTSAVGRGVTQLLVGTILGTVARKVTKSERIASLVVASAYANVIRENAGLIPGVGQFLGGVGVYPRVGGGNMGVYPKAVNPGIGVYPRAGLSGWAPRGVPEAQYGQADPRVLAGNRRAQTMIA